LLALITQNIDGLHQPAGHATDTVIEVHGTMREVMCMACGWRGPMELALDRLRGARIVIVNAEPTPFDQIADASCVSRLARSCPGYFSSAAVDVAGPMPTICRTQSSSFAPS
jgi:NAD-dependent SIR2 family protein deacetylase